MSAKQSKKGRKVGRNAVWCNAYRLRNQREKNKAIKLMRYIEKHGHTDLVALNAFKELSNYWPDGAKQAVADAEAKRRAMLNPNA
jgi:hypothetical protein